MMKKIESNEVVVKPEEVKILVVDDEPLLLETIVSVFQMYGFNVEFAENGNRAYELFEKNNYNLILSDIRMPQGDGIELAKKIKAKNAKTPTILFMTGHSDILNEEIYHVGAEGKFNKPFDTAAVRQAIETCLLAKDIRWEKPFSASGRIVKTEKSAESLEKLESDQSVIFGRGGFFLSLESPLPERNALVSFSIKINGPEVIHFQGVGAVRWVQNQPKVGIRTGVGLEIINMKKPESQKYVSLFENRISYIPSPTFSKKA
jgi:CheY-like chemotaxis protein